MIKDLQNNLTCHGATVHNAAQKIAALARPACPCQRDHGGPPASYPLVTRAHVSKKVLRRDAPWLLLYQNPAHPLEADFVAHYLQTEYVSAAFMD